MHLLPALAMLPAALIAQPRDPARLLADPEALAHPESLPQAAARTVVVFPGEPGTSGFNLHSYIARYKGLFWVIWSSSRLREEDPDQLVRYSTSRDGRHWTPARVLAEDPDGPSQPARWIARGLYVDRGNLQALAARVESAAYRDRGRGEVWKNLKLVRFEWTGKSWRDRGIFAEDCMNNFPPVRLGSTLAMPCRDSFMRVFMALGGAPAWSRTSLGSAPPFDRMDEPTLYEGADGYAHLIVRDNRRSGRLIHMVSSDQGHTWSNPVLTNYPDATSKNFAGRLADGRYFLINNPDPRRRDPLAISYSPEGWVYSRPAAIRRGGGTFQYPHAVEYGESLWVVYSADKRSIELSRLPLLH